MGRGNLIELFFFSEYYCIVWILWASSCLIPFRVCFFAGDVPLGRGVHTASATCHVTVTSQPDIVGDN